MKKILAVLFAALMLLSSAVFPVFADGEDPIPEEETPVSFYLTGPDYTKLGSEFSIFLNVEGEYEAHIISMHISFDPDCVEFVGYETLFTTNSNTMVSPGVTFDGDEFAYGIVVMSGAGVTATGAIARIDFKALDGVTEELQFGIRMQMFRYRPVGGSPVNLDYTLEGVSIPLLGRPSITLENLPESGKVKVSWEAVPFAEKYQVYRSAEKSSGYKLVKTTSNLSYINTSAQPGETWYYKVRGVTASGDTTKYSSSKYRTTDLPRPVVKGTHVASTGKNKLTWDAVEGAKEYKVYRSEEPDGEFKLMKTTENTSYVNTNSTAGNVYYYYVVAIHENSSANSAPSLTKTLTCDLPAPVVTLSYTSSGKPKLAWEAIEGAKEYKVYRSEEPTANFKLLKTTANLTFTNTSVTSGATYYYKVMAVHETNSAANSAYSAAVTAVIQ